MMPSLVVLCQELDRIRLAFRIEPIQPHCAAGLYLLQVALRNEPLHRGVRLQQTAVNLLFQQPPAGDPLKTVGSLRVPQEIAEYLPSDHRVGF